MLYKRPSEMMSHIPRSVPRSVLITGANRGIGFGLVKHLLASHPRPQHVIATSRSLGREKSKELEELAAKEDCLSVIQLSIDNPATFSTAVGKVDSIVQEHGLNVLVHNAGIGDRDSLENVTVDKMIKAFSIHTIGPLMLTQSLLPSLKRASHHASIRPLGWERAAIVNVSSLFASISVNGSSVARVSGGWYAYRCSKTAINAITKSLSIDLLKDGIISCSIHPGWVKTDMSGPNAAVTVDDCVQGMLQVMANMNQYSNGGFFQYDGTVIDW